MEAVMAPTPASGLPPPSGLFVGELLPPQPAVRSEPTAATVGHRRRPSSESAAPILSFARRPPAAPTVRFVFSASCIGASPGNTNPSGGLPAWELVGGGCSFSHCVDRPEKPSSTSKYLNGTRGRAPGAGWVARENPGRAGAMQHGPGRN